MEIVVTEQCHKGRRIFVHPTRVSVKFYPCQPREVRTKPGTGPRLFNIEKFTRVEGESLGITELLEGIYFLLQRTCLIHLVIPIYRLAKHLVNSFSMVIQSWVHLFIAECFPVFYFILCTSFLR